VKILTNMFMKKMFVNLEDMNEYIRCVLMCVCVSVCLCLCLIPTYARNKESKKTKICVRDKNIYIY